MYSFNSAAYSLPMSHNSTNSNSLDRIQSVIKATLSESDWTQLSDVSLSKEKKAAWKKYRQELRLLLNTYDGSEDLVLPEMPS